MNSCSLWNKQIPSSRELVDKNKRVPVHIADLDAQVEIDSCVGVNDMAWASIQGLITPTQMTQLTLKPTVCHTAQTSNRAWREMTTSHSRQKEQTPGVKTQVICDLEDK